MGHASINNTMDVYGHLMKDVNSEAPLKLQNAIFKKVVTLGVETAAAETKKALNRYMAKCFILLVSRAGVEPTTYGLKVRCSTN
jgi:hypothetical protein